VTLTRNAPTISLTRHGVLGGTLRVNLSWTTRLVNPPTSSPRVGILKQLVAEPLQHHVDVDLDLGCLYELSTGQRGAVQALGERFGNFENAPYIKLDTDDRLGTGSGENLFINLGHAAQLRRVLVFAYIYNGARAFDRAEAVVTLFPASGAAIEIALDEQGDKARSCAVALIQNEGGELVVRREVRYVEGFQAELDRLYGFGMRWAPGRKR
jgi:uncharacterized protein involved in tellurium resistance